jgi:hypothetical protein
LVFPSEVKNFLEFIVYTIRQQNSFADDVRIRFFVKMHWFFFNDLTLQHLCNFDKRVAICTVTPRQKFFFVPSSAKPRLEFWMSLQGAHDTGTTILHVTTCRTGARRYNLLLRHES